MGCVVRRVSSDVSWTMMQQSQYCAVCIDTNIGQMGWLDVAFLSRAWLRFIWVRYIARLDILPRYIEMWNKTKKVTIYIRTSYLADNLIWSGWWQEWENKEAEERKVHWHHHRRKVLWQTLNMYLISKEFWLSRVTSDELHFHVDIN